MSKKNYSVTITQNLTRTVRLPVPGLNLTKEQVEEVLAKMSLDGFFEPEGCQTQYGDILNEKSKNYNFHLDEYEYDPEWDKAVFSNPNNNQSLNGSFYEEFEEQCDKLNFVGEGL